MVGVLTLLHSMHQHRIHVACCNLCAKYEYTHVFVFTNTPTNYVALMESILLKCSTPPHQHDAHPLAITSTIIRIKLASARWRNIVRHERVKIRRIMRMHAAAYNHHFSSAHDARASLPRRWRKEKGRARVRCAPHHHRRSREHASCDTQNSLEPTHAHRAEHRSNRKFGSRLNYSIVSLPCCGMHRMSAQVDVVDTFFHQRSHSPHDFRY